MSSSDLVAANKPSRFSNRVEPFLSSSRRPARPSSSNNEPASACSMTKEKPMCDVEAEQFREYWEALPIDEQAKLERDAMNSAPMFHRDTIQRLEASDSDLKLQMRMRLIRDYIGAQASKP